MSNFDYFIKNPNRAFRFTIDGFQLTPMAKTAIEIDATNKSQNTIGGHVEKEEYKKTLIKAMEYRLKQEAANYIEE